MAEGRWGCLPHHVYTRKTTGELERLQGQHLPSHPEPGVSFPKGTGAGRLWPLFLPVISCHLHCQMDWIWNLPGDTFGCVCEGVSRKVQLRWEGPPQIWVAPSAGWGPGLNKKRAGSQ